MKLLDYATLALATWRLSSYLSNEQGPAGIFETFRQHIGIEYSREDTQFATNWLASEIMCNWCSTFYAGTFWTILYRIFPKFTMWIAYPFAFSSLAILILTSKTMQVYIRNLNK